MSLLPTDIENTSVSTEATDVIQDTPVTLTQEAGQIDTPEVQTVAKNTTGATLAELLSDEFKDFKSLQSFKNVNDLAKSYIHANSLLGKKMSDMKPEDIAVLNSLRGIPESEDSYSLPEELSPDLASFYKKVSLKAGLTQEQAKTIVDSFIELDREENGKISSSTEQQLVDWQNELKAEFGSALNQRVDIARRGLNAFGDESLKQLLKDTGLHQHPAMVKLFAKVGKELLEDSFIEADKATKFGITPADADAMIKKNLADNEFRSAYFSATHPGHQLAVQEMTRLYGLLSSKK